MHPRLKRLVLLGSLIGLCIAVVVSFYFYGLSLPENHREEINVELDANPERVWAVITSYSEFPTWWSEVKSTREEVSKEGTRVTWNSDQKGKVLGFVTEEEVPPIRLVRRMVDEGLPFGGTWTFELKPLEGGHTRLTLTERGFIRAPLYRAMGHLVFGLRTQIESFSASLRKKMLTGF